MTSFSCVGVIGALILAVGCGGELALDPDIQPVPAAPSKAVPSESRPTPDPPGTVSSRSDAPSYPAITDLASDDAKKVCSMRAAAAKERKLGTFESKGWTGLENATGVDALFYEGGSSTGGPIAHHHGLQLAFPVPIVIDAVTGTSTVEEKIYQLRYTWTSGESGPPPDLFQPGSSYDLRMQDASWGYRCSSKGGDMADNWNSGDVKVTITARTPDRVDGILERKGAAGVETLSFSAPTSGTYATSTIASEGVCCLGKY